MTTSSSGCARPAFAPSVWHLIAELLSLLRIAALDFAPEAVCGYDVAIRVERSRENVTRFSLVTRCSARR
jgi:hypothetical protein